MKTITRKQYLNKDATHREYYGQFVTPLLITMVVNNIGAKRIASSNDPSLNDIPLKEWDRLPVFTYVNADLWNEANGTGGHSLSEIVCIAKQAARQYADQERKKTARYVVLTRGDAVYFDDHPAAFDLCESIAPIWSDIKGVFKLVTPETVGPTNVYGSTRDLDAARTLASIHGFKHTVI